MPAKRGGGGNAPDTMSKKAAGQARKAETAANKKAAKTQEAEAAETQKWELGSKDSSRKEAAASKAAELARKKAERAALEAEEMAGLKSAKAGSAKGAGKKGGAAAAPKSRGLDLAQLDDAEPSSSKATALNATGIDSALDALSLTSGTVGGSIERHPERRFKGAYTAFETRRLDEMKDDKTLRRNQKIEAIRKEFERSPENPFNQVSATYNSTKDEVSALRTAEVQKIENQFGN